LWRPRLLQALHRLCERLVSQRTGIIDQIRTFMLERGIAARQGIGFLRMELLTILTTRTDALSPRMLGVTEELAGDWRWLGQRIDGLSGEIEALARQDQACLRLMTVPGIGPIVSSAKRAHTGGLVLPTQGSYPRSPSAFPPRSRSFRWVILSGRENAPQRRR
jgi:transposase